MKISLEQKIGKLLAYLTENQIKIFLYLEAQSIGFGGIAAVSKASGESRQTIILN